MSQWYLSYEGQQVGPLDQVQATARAKSNPKGFAWREGLAEWLPISQVAELSQQAPAGMAPPPPSTRASDKIDFKIKTALFGGEGLFFATLHGPGRVWLQSLPFSRLAGRMLQAAPQRGGSRGEGSILGGLGNLLDGDNN